MYIYYKLLIESLRFALQSLYSNKLRTLLSLLGITIGIFAIISVFSVIDSLRNSISDSIQSLGDDVVYVHKWPWEMGGKDVPWWKYLNRPQPTEDEFKILENRLLRAQAVAFSASGQAKIEFLSQNIESVKVLGVTNSYQKVRTIDLAQGRYFTQNESNTGNPVVILGHTIAENLFGEMDAIGREIKVAGRNAVVIGVLEKQGTDMFGQSLDQGVLSPALFLSKWVDFESERSEPQIIVKAKEGADINVLKDEIRKQMRSIRRIKPRDDDNFALNQTSMITKGFEAVFGVIDWAGIIIGGFSILVGAFGIANIMFVSVKERTKLIGIQKALGAKSFFILFQFIFESVFLSIIGGILGLILVAILVFTANQIIDMEFVLTLTNIIRGIAISFVVGIVAGYIPAKTASMLNPVNAINSNF